MDKELLKSLGQIHDDLISLALYAEVNKVELVTLTRDAKRADALVPGGYLDLPKYFIYCKSKAEEASKKAQLAKGPKGTIETTTNTPLLRGQVKRLNSLNERHQSRIVEIDRMLKTERDQQRKSDLETERANKRSKVESNQTTLAKVEKRLKELSGSSAEGTINQ